MRYTTNNLVQMAFYTESKEVIESLHSSLEANHEQSVSNLLSEISGKNSYKLHYDGIVYFNDRSIAVSKSNYVVKFTADFKGLSNINLLNYSIGALSDKFGPYKARLVYYDESARVNSDVEGIVFDERIRIEYNVLKREKIRVEYYSSTDELVSHMQCRGIILHPTFDPSERDDMKELEDKLEDSISYANIIFFQYDYPTELDNKNIIQFMHKLD